MKTKKTRLIVLAVVFLLLGYGFNLTSFTPRWFEEGRVYNTVFAEPVGARVLLIAKEENSFYYEDPKVFMALLSERSGYPPKRFRIRMGKVYPIEWSRTWGHQN